MTVLDMAGFLDVRGLLAGSGCLDEAGLLDVPEFLDRPGLLGMDGLVDMRRILDRPGVPDMAGHFDMCRDLERPASLDMAGLLDVLGFQIRLDACFLLVRLWLAFDQTMAQVRIRLGPFPFDRRSSQSFIWFFSGR